MTAVTTVMNAQMAMLTGQTMLAAARIHRIHADLGSGVPMMRRTSSACPPFGGRCRGPAQVLDDGEDQAEHDRQATAAQSRNTSEHDPGIGAGLAIGVSATTDSDDTR